MSDPEGESAYTDHERLYVEPTPVAEDIDCTATWHDNPEPGTECPNWCGTKEPMPPRKALDLDALEAFWIEFAERWEQPTHGGEELFARAAFHAGYAQAQARIQELEGALRESRNGLAVGRAVLISHSVPREHSYVSAPHDVKCQEKCHGEAVMEIDKAITAQNRIRIPPAPPEEIPSDPS